MPPFVPGESKTAIALITAKPSGMNCEAELFLGPDDATKAVSSGRMPFVSTGEAKNVSLPITMPVSPGIYHGYIDVFAEDLRFLAYILKEDVVIASPALFVMGDMQVEYSQAGMGGPDKWYTMNTYWVDIINRGGEAATRKIRWWGTSPQNVTPQSGEKNITIQPGGTYRWSLVQYMRGVDITYYLEGDWEGANFAQATGHSYQWADCYGSLTRFPFCAKLTHYCDIAAGMCYELRDGQWVRVS